MQKPKDMELRTLNKRHAFGIKSDVYGCVHWLDENTIAYPVGRNVVMHNIQSNAQKFFLTSEKTEAITAIALSPNKKFIAIAESGEHPQIQVVDTGSRKRRKVLNVTDLGSDRFVCMQFSSDGRHLATQGGAPQWNLLYWNWERSKPLAQVQVTREQALPHTREANHSVVSHISINPRDPLHIVVSGNGLFRFYRYVDGLLKASSGGLGKAHTQNFTTHNWVTEDRIIVATDNADLLLIEEGEFRCPLPVAPSDNHAIFTIAPTTKGFVCGGEMGLINIFEETDDKELYKKVATLSIDSESSEEASRKCSIKHFALTHGEETLVMATSTLQVYGLNFNVDWSKIEKPSFNSIVERFHAGPIVGLDACIRKPLVATSSVDKTVRIWNTQEHTCEIVKTFATEPGAVALHPSGLHILVCFHDKVWFMNLYGDTIQTFKQLTVRSVSEVKFSIGGQYFAVVHGNVIQIYNTATCDMVPIAQLRGHSQKVKSLQWCATTQFPTDTRIVSCSMDGTVIDWNLRDMRKENDHTDKRFQYHAVASDDKSIWVVGAPASSQTETKWKVKLREIDVNSMHGDTIANDYEFPDLFMNSLALAPQHRLLFGGCTDGSVKLMTFPLQGGIHDPPILAHATAITKMAVSFDESMLFTVGNDGSFYVFDIKEDGRTTKRETTYAEEILISKSALEEKTNSAASLHQVLDDLTLDMEYQDKRHGMTHDEDVKETTDRYKDQQLQLAGKLEREILDTQDQKRSFDAKKKEKAEEHRSESEREEREKVQQLNELDAECKKRKEEKDDQARRFKEELEKLDENFERLTREDDEKFNTELTHKQDELQKLENHVNRTKQTQHETRSQLEMDTDAEIESIRKRNEDALQKERDKFLHMKGENAIMKKNFTLLTKEIDNRAAEIKALDTTKTKLDATIKELSDRIKQLHDDIEERDSTIGEKEKKIYELKKRNQDLEKHKFVLDHRIRQLKSQIEPKQMEISRENEKIKIKDGELEQYHKNNLALRMNIEELKAQIAAQQKEIKQLLNKLKDFETYKSRVKTDIGELAQKVQDPDLLRTGINKMYKDHVDARGGRRCAALEGDLKDEFGAHTEFLAKTVESLKRKVTEDMQHHKSEISGVMAENLRLISEIHELRKEIRTLKQASSEVPQSSTQAPQAAPHGSQREVGKEIETNRSEIQRLRSKIEDLERSLNNKAAVRPASRDRLPPMQ